MNPDAHPCGVGFSPPQPPLAIPDLPVIPLRHPWHLGRQRILAATPRRR